MSKPFYELDEGHTVVNGVPFDDVTFARLCELCEAAAAPMQAVIFAIVRDVLEDDAITHDPNLGPDLIRKDSNHDLN